jgi:hypothetical protein
MLRKRGRAKDNAATEARSIKARERRRRLRQRRKQGIVVAPVEVDRDLLNFIIDRLHWLSEGEAQDRYAIGRAITQGFRITRDASRQRDQLRAMMPYERNSFET